MRCYFLVVTLGLSGCFDFGPSQSGTCGERHVVCSLGQRCVEGVCQDAVPAADASASADLFVAPVDMAQPADMADPFAWDRNKPPSVVPGCKSGIFGYEFVPGKMDGCLTTVAARTIRQQCAVGWMLCNLPLIPMNACANIPSQWGFFVGNLWGWQQKNPVDFSMEVGWSMETATSQRYIFGCGQTSGTASLKAPMNGWGVAMNCVDGNSGGLASNWSCPHGSPPGDTDYESITNSKAMFDGVACCHP